MTPPRGEDSSAEGELADVWEILFFAFMLL